MITTAISKDLEPLQAAKETKNKPFKCRGTRRRMHGADETISGKKTDTKATPLDKARTIIGLLENEARDYLTNKSQTERNKDEKVFALIVSRFGTRSSKFPYASIFPYS